MRKTFVNVALRVCTIVSFGVGCGTSGGPPPRADFGHSPVDAAHPHDLFATVSDANGDLDVEHDLALGCGQGCTAPTPSCDPKTGTCVPCLTDDDTCPAGSFCAGADGGASANSCQAGCKSDMDCSGDGGLVRGACCNHQCVDLSSDGQNCGNCGSSCNTKSCCNSQCIDTSEDPNNCGSCGTSCSQNAPHANVDCRQSKCAITGCVAPYADCNMNPADGCEADLSTDPANCTMCGNFCAVPNGMGGCDNGCTVAGCYPGFAHCTKKVLDGCETAVSKDPMNCGMCGNVCPAPPNAVAGCAGGMCNVGGCTMGFADCNMNPMDGCEASLQTDPNNCGMCGTQCAALANANAGCAMGACAILSCQQGFANCNLKNIDGCEVNTSTDLKNCGKCANVCPAVANGVGACTNGNCTVASCTAGFLDCDLNPANGCEVSSLTDAKNCGGCAIACAQGLVCQAGMCINNPQLQFSAAFVTGQASPAQCTTWNTFRTSLVGNFTMVTIKGSVDAVGVTCMGAGANTICQALHTGATTSVACSGRTWNVGTCGAGIELSANGSICQCTSPGYIARPCIANANWGGDNTATCNGPSQTITVICQ